MAISTFAELKTAVSNWLGGRSDLDSRIPEFVTMAEARINYGADAPFQSNPLRIGKMLTTSDVSLVANTATASLPTGYLEARRMYVAGDTKRTLDYIAPTLFWGMNGVNETGLPKAYTIEGDNIVFSPVPDTAYTLKLLHYKAFDALSADDDTNWLLTNAPNAYLYSTLFEASIYTRNQANQQLYLGLARSTVNGLNKASAVSQASGAPMVARPDVSIA